MHLSHPNRPIWLNSYKEEYCGLTDVATFDVISAVEYYTIHSSTSKTAIPLMGILSVNGDAVSHPAKPKVTLLSLVIKT